MGRGKSQLTDVTPLMCSSATCGADVLDILTLSASVPGRLQLFCLHSESPQDSLSREAVAVEWLQLLSLPSESPQDSLSRAAVVVGWLQHRWSAHASVSRSVVSDSVTPWIVALQASLSVGFSARTLERVVMPPPGHLPALAGGCFTTGAACKRLPHSSVFRSQPCRCSLAPGGECQSSCRSLLRTWKPSPSAGVNIKL